mgnify:FL=1
MYVGIGPEKGKKVHDEDAFPYACERINNGSEREQEAFMQIMKEAESFYMAAIAVVLWYFSGNWVHEEVKP